MRLKSPILWILIAAACDAFVQPQGRIDPSKCPSPQPHDQPEYTFDRCADPAEWTEETAGLHAAFGSTDRLYLRCEAPFPASLSRAWEGTGWRGERLNAQVLIWSRDTLHQVRIKVEALKKAGGKIMLRERFRLNLVRYVVSNYPYAAGNSNCDAAPDSAWLMPDRFEPFERFDLPAGTVRPVWISVDIPASCEPGLYTGDIAVEAMEGSVGLKAALRVQKQVLPGPREWKFRLDLWQNPWVVASYYRVEPWCDEHLLLLKKHLRLYADAGGKVITTYAVHSPWSDNSYTVEGGMIGWTRTAGGTWKFDYSIFDRYVELAVEAGVRESITVYTPLPWGHRFRYRDERTGNDVDEEWAPSSDRYRAAWLIFLDDLMAHLKSKGWFEKAYLGINENPLEQTLAAIGVIREHSEDWKITYAGNWHPELSPLLDDYSTILGNEPPDAELRGRAARGSTSTFYVCCTPPRPNNFLFSPPVEGRFMGWYAAGRGYDGFLRWAYDAWPADPARDGRHTHWPAGDCFLVYPGGSGIRFEKLREGIADYEKIRILRRRALNSRSESVKGLMPELDAVLAAVAAEPVSGPSGDGDEGMAGTLQKGRMLIEKLGDALED